MIEDKFIWDTLARVLGIHDVTIDNGSAYSVLIISLRFKGLLLQASFTSTSSQGRYSSTVTESFQLETCPMVSGVDLSSSIATGRGARWGNL